MSRNSNDEIKEIVAGCSHCKAKISQFMTKKPVHNSERGTQTTHKAFLIDLIEERVEQVCRQKAELEKIVEEREEEIMDRQQEIAEIEEKFTGILLSMAQEVGYRRNRAADWHELSRAVVCESDTPSYLKALRLDTP